MPQFRIESDPEYDLVTKVGSIQLEWGVRDRELEQELQKAQEHFVRAMEIRGLILYRHQGMKNPQWTTNEDGSMAAWYALDWTGERPPPLGPDGKPLPHTRESSLEETMGQVEYRIVGVFWGPRTTLEILKPRQEILDDEHRARDPVQFGYGSKGGGDRLYESSP